MSPAPKDGVMAPDENVFLIVIVAGNTITITLDFYNCKLFSYFFKKNAGITPVEFRKNYVRLGSQELAGR
jgi:hypothetical protein